MRAEALFPDGPDLIDVDGVSVRKGSIASFIHNALALERLDPESHEYQEATAEMREVVPALRAVRLFEVFSPRLERAATLVREVDPLLLAPEKG